MLFYIVAGLIGVIFEIVGLPIIEDGGLNYVNSLLLYVAILIWNIIYTMVELNV